MSTEIQDRPATDEIDFEYRSVSLLSILGLVLGLGSILALVSPIGWIVPAAGALVSIVAAIRVHANSDRFTGMNLAIVGLSLSLWFGAWAPTKFFTDRHYLASQAASFSSEWLESVVDANLEKAHQGTLEFRYRQPDKADLSKHYKGSEVDRADMNEYFAEGLIKDIVSRPKGTKIERMRVRTISKRKSSYEVVNIFDVIPPDSETITIAIEATRRKYKGNFYWQVTGATDPVALFGEE